MNAYVFVWSTMTSAQHMVVNKGVEGSERVLKRWNKLIARGHQREEERREDNSLMGILIRDLSGKGTIERQQQAKTTRRDNQGLLSKSHDGRTFPLTRTRDYRITTMTNIMRLRENRQSHDERKGVVGTE